jgi:aminomethyltransferase
MSALRTPLLEVHEEAGANMTEFAGWRLPASYGSITAEVKAVRASAGLFDVSHMGRLRVSGNEPAALLDRLITSDISGLAPGRARYGLLAREDGTILDDVLAYRDADAFFVCVNASNRHRDLAWMRAHAAGAATTIEDLTDATAMLAVQGPRAAEIVAPLCSADVRSLRSYGFLRTAFCGAPDVLVSRTGYTGEDGFEVWPPAAHAVECWKRIMAAGADKGLVPIGLAARDVLRLEAGMPLYTHEIDDSTTPVEAQLMWAVKLDKDFVGADSIREVAERGTIRKLVGFTCDARRIPRYGYTVFDGDVPSGQVLSGALSPTLGRCIGTAYVPAARAVPGTEMSLDLRGSRTPIQIVELPFYRRPRQQNPGGTRS